MPDSFLSKLVSRAMSELFSIAVSPDDILLQKTRKEFKGQKTLVVFPFAKASGQPPEKTAALLGEYLKAADARIMDFNVVKGFLNLELHDSVYIQHMSDILKQGHLASFSPVGETVLVEYSSPNTNKPLHLGHLRNNLLGWSVAALLQEAGFDVKKVSVINDRGIHICKSMVAYMRKGKQATPASMQMKGDHLVGHFYVAFDAMYKAEIEELVASGKEKEWAEAHAPVMLEAKELLRRWEAGEEEVVSLWRTMNNWVYDGFAQTYKRMGVDFDKLYYESQTYLLGKKVVQDGLAQQVFYKENDGSVWMDLSAEGLDKKIVQRSDGTSVYITQDLGTALERQRDYQFARMIYVVGNEQDYHFKVLFKMLGKLGYSWADKLYHLSYGMVELPEGKMKSREGTVVDADDLMEEMVNTAKEITTQLGKTEGLSETECTKLYETIGLGAIKYYLLKVDPRKKMLFDPKESIDFQGNTGPFVQYTHARICSLLRKADFSFSGISGDIKLSEPEKNVLVLLTEYSEVIHDAAHQYNPGLLANYVYEVAKEYNHFYHDFPVMRESDERIKMFRLCLSAYAGLVIKKGFSLLGIDVPERM
jgi:arginyl-tRNA synthetase